MFLQALNNIKRYSSVSFDIGIILTLFLFFIGCLFLSKNNFDNFADTIKNKLEIAIFLKNNISTDKNSLIGIEKEIPQDNVKKLEFVDKKTALDKFIEDNPELQEQVAILEENPLKNYFLVKLKNSNYKNVKKFVDQIVELNFVDDIVYSEDLIKNVDSFLKYMFKVGVIFFMFALVIVVWMVKYIIKISLHYRKLEFVLWRYLGVQKNVEILLIFFEALLIGIIASLVSMGFLLVFFYFISLFLFNLEFLKIGYIILIFCIGIGGSLLVNFIVYKKSKNEVF